MWDGSIAIDQTPIRVFKMSDENVLTNEIIEQVLENDNSVEPSEFTTFEDDPTATLNRYNGTDEWLSNIAAATEKLATDKRLDPTVTIERIQSNAARSKPAFLRNHTEVRSIATLNHPCAENS